MSSRVMPIRPVTRPRLVYTLRMTEPADTRDFLLPAGLLLGLALIAQLACWGQVVSQDATPLVGDSGELYRLGLLHSQNLREGDGRPLPPLLGHLLGHWLELVGPGQFSLAVLALLLYLALIAIAWQLGQRLGDGPASGFIAAMIAASLPGLIGPSRYLIPDQPAAIWIGLICLLLIDSDGGLRWTPMLLGGLLFGSALLVKVSLLCYLVPLAGWFGWQLYHERGRWPRFLVSLLISLAVALPWYLYNGRTMLAFYLSDPAANSPGAWGMPRPSAVFLLYYPRILWFELAGPLMGGLMLLGLLAALRQRRLRGWMLYVLAVVLLLTCSPFRVPRYAFALLPLLAAIAAAGLASLLRRPRICLVAGGLIGLLGACWSASLLLSPRIASRFPPMALHQPGNLHAEDLAGIGLFAPRAGPWAGPQLAELIAQHAGPKTRILIIGTRQFGLWDVRLRLLERGLDLPFCVPRMLPSMDLERILPRITMVLISDYSIHERDYLRRNIWPMTEAEYRRRGYQIEVEVERWFAHNQAHFDLYKRVMTPDGKYIALYLRR